MIDQWLRRHKVLICIGSGGVGKTTLSAALGVLAAQSGLRTLVLTIDPARRLAGALGLESGEGDFAVPGVERLTASMIDAEKIFEQFVRRSAPSEEVARRLLANRLYRQLSTTLNGSQEFTSLDRLLTAIDSAQFDLIILDTPPAQNASDFLRAPERIFSLFQESVTRWFVEPDQGTGIIQRIFHRSTRTALAALEKITGSGFISELSSFFSSMGELQSQVSQRSLRVHRLLTQPDTGFVLITGFDEAKLAEAEEHLQDLVAGDHHISAVVINRFQPQWLGAGADTEPSSGDPKAQLLAAYYKKMRGYFGGRQAGYEAFSKRISRGIPVLRIAEMRESVSGVDGLKAVAQLMAKEFEKVIK